MRLLLLLVALLLGLPAWAQPVITENAKLVGSSADAFATAGWAIAAADGFVVLGAFRDDSAPTTGAAYVFRETAGGWEEETRLNASQQSFFTFGMAVGAWSDSREDVVIAGARGDSFRPETDAAYIFRRSVDAEWVQEARLTNGADIHESFGHAVAIHGDYAVVGAVGADDAGGTTGAAYAFRRTTDGMWVEEARLLASDASVKAGFGRGVSIVVSSDGVPFALIGAPSDSDQRGAAYAFRRTPEGTWVEEAKLVAPDANVGDLFGLGVALVETPDGEILALAGATSQDINGMLSVGAGYVFRREGDNAWVFEKKLIAANGSKAQGLGWSVALAAAPNIGGTVAVLGGDRAYNFAGTVRLFRRTSEGGVPLWTEEAELWASDRTPGDQIGYSVGASGRYAVAGAPNNDDGRGAGYVWDLRRAVPAESEPVAGADSAELTAYPNPAAGGPVTLQLRLPRATHVRIDAYDVLGRRVAMLADGRVEAGRQVFILDGRALPTGVYLVRAEVGGQRFSQRITVVR
ncbi:MAG: T9SS type A sorting domain-containing protein [Rhodothermales bacterium]